MSTNGRKKLRGCLLRVRVFKIFKIPAQLLLANTLRFAISKTATSRARDRILCDTRDGREAAFVDGRMMTDSELLLEEAETPEDSR